jgi:TatD DNase family protein
MKAKFIDTHTHLYLEAFENDRDEVIERAVSKGVGKMFLPNINHASIEGMMWICEKYNGICYPMMGLHPTSVKENYEEELNWVKENLKNKNFIAVGEIGIDLYWDKTLFKQQQDALRRQLRWAKEEKIPVVIHSRDSFEEIFEIMDDEITHDLKGVFHSFTGNQEHVKKILSYGFYIGINGIITFKNSGLREVIPAIPLDKLLIETDSPFLAPTPMRGKRNESAYVIRVAEELAGILSIDVSEISEITSNNALNLFKRAN